MRVLLIVLGVFLFGFGAQAAESEDSPWHVDFLPLTVELRYERDSTQQTTDRRPVNLALGIRKGASTILFEYSSFTEETGNATLFIARKHQEYSFWWKESLMNFELLDFFISGGLGGYQEKVTTTLAGSGSATDTNGFLAMGGAGAGIQTLIFRNIILSLEGRFIAGQNFDPNPQADLLVRVGVEF
jgi:hypothetical protein